MGYSQVTPIKPKSEQALAADAEAAAEARSVGTVVTRSVAERFDMAQEAVIGFDMGGTSTDVSRYNGVFEHIFENTTAGITIQAPQLDINVSPSLIKPSTCFPLHHHAELHLTVFFFCSICMQTVAAGGGSMLFFKNGLFVVGPDSAGAHPGPAWSDHATH